MGRAVKDYTLWLYKEFQFFNAPFAWVDIAKPRNPITATYIWVNFVMIEELRKIITEEKEEIRSQYKAQIKAVFGSYARGDFHANSDLDLLVDVDAGATLLDLVGLRQFLEDRLGCKVDVVTRRSLREELRAVVFSEAIYL